MHVLYQCLTETNRPYREMFAPCSILIQPAFLLIECVTAFVGRFDITKSVRVLETLAAPVSPFVSTCTIFSFTVRSIHFVVTHIDTNDCMTEDFHSFQMVFLHLQTRDQI